MLGRPSQSCGGGQTAPVNSPPGLATVPRISSAAFKLSRTPHSRPESTGTLHASHHTLHLHEPPPGSWHLLYTYTYMFVFQTPCCMLYPGKPHVGVCIIVPGQLPGQGFSLNPTPHFLGSSQSDTPTYELYLIDSSQTQGVAQGGQEGMVQPWLASNHLVGPYAQPSDWPFQRI